MTNPHSFAARSGARLPAGLFATISNRVRIFLAFAALFIMAALAAGAAEEHPFLHPLFCDHAVLQRGVPVPVWGWSAPGSKVTVTFAGQSRATITGTDGKWLVKFKSMRAASEPRVLSVTNSTTHEAAVINDVLVGDVWLCSGQSNMEMGVLACNATNDVAAANFPLIRLLTVPRRIATQPVETMQCRWLPCSPDTIKQGLWGGFSAAGFFFGRELNRELNIPIGLIHSSWGGTVAEAWTSAEGLAPLGDFNDAIQSLRDGANSPRKTDYLEIYEKWCQQKDPGTQKGWATGAGVDASWKSVQMPQPFQQAGLPGFNGMVWFQREFDLPAEWTGKDLKLDLGPVDDFDTTWINGVKVGQMNRYDLIRSYTVPASAVKPGKNILTIRVMDTGGIGGLTAQPEQMKIAPAGDKSAAPIQLAGTWQMRDSAPLAQLGSPPPPLDENNPNVVTVLYDGMIAPLLPFAIKGAIWYQGESNADRAKQYRRLLPAMIGDWRARFGVGDFPFYIVQLAAFQATNAEPRENNWAELREAQAWTAKNVPNCGLALAIDIGDAGDIHPKNKQEVGRRLALDALAQTYGKKVECSGPWYRSMKVDGDKIRLEFDHADRGLVAKGDKLTGFAIAGEDRKFVWADAVIDGQTVIVSSAAVPKPVAVRYAWDINPVCNLCNQAGLPAVPFRTDDETGRPQTQNKNP
jgi:sialate O-acetylesterase